MRSIVFLTALAALVVLTIWCLGFGTWALASLQGTPGFISQSPANFEVGIDADADAPSTGDVVLSWTGDLSSDPVLWVPELAGFEVSDCQPWGDNPGTVSVHHEVHWEQVPLTVQQAVESWEGDAGMPVVGDYWTALTVHSADGTSFDMTCDHLRGLWRDVPGGRQFVVPEVIAAAPASAPAIAANEPCEQEVPVDETILVRTGAESFFRKGVPDPEHFGMVDRIQRTTDGSNTRLDRTCVSSLPSGFLVYDTTQAQWRRDAQLVVAGVLLPVTFVVARSLWRLLSRWWMSGRGRHATG